MAVFVSGQRPMDLSVEIQFNNSRSSTMATLGRYSHSDVCLSAALVVDVVDFPRVVAFMTEKRIQVYDSMGSSGRRYLDAIFRYLDDEHMDKKKERLPDKDEWVLVETTRDTPQQRNGTCYFGCVTLPTCCHSIMLFF